ncbi:hypothetical protein KY339_00495 [Candidatus Woesearchaeota archaeon]|nr:hypothetical protein [Candidatus Woesearchaeota archaeon]
MKRKIIKLGQATYVASLPSKWIRKYNLEKGDYLTVEESEDSLVFSAKEKLVKIELTIDLDVSNYNRRTIFIMLHQAYRKGFDKLKVKFKDKEQLEIIRRITKDTLLGFEVVKEEDNKCVLQNIAEPSPEKFDVILRKEMLLIKEDINGIHESFKNNTFEMQKREDVKESFDNFNNFARRVIIKNKVEGPKNSYLLYYFVSQLSLIQHGYYYLYKLYNKEQPKKIDKVLLELLKKTNDVYDLLYQSFYKKDIALAHKTRKESDDIQKDIYKEIQKGQGLRNNILLVLSNIIRTIAVATTVLFGLEFENPEEKLS